MLTSLIKIGNSRGVRIPKTLLTESGLEKDVELKAKKGEIKIIPVVNKKGEMPENAILSEKVLAKDWNRKEEDEAWKNL